MSHLLLAVIYLSFIGLGLPDSLLGAAWPSMYGALDVPVSYAGILSMIIAAGTILSGLQSDRLVRKLGAGRLTLISVGMTAAAIFGFSLSRSFGMLCLWAVPYGLGAGSVDAALNNYVALHFASRHMSWLHCMWGVGASLGPYIMGYALTGGSWSMGYGYVALLQMVLTAVLLLTLPLWKKTANGDEKEAPPLAMTTGRVLRIPGAKAVMLTFFCYCTIEQTAGLWAGSYLALQKRIPAETAAGFAGLFFVGITIGRALSGFLTMKRNDEQMIRLGQIIIAVGIAALLLPFGEYAALAGLILIGLGCAPIYPCMIHATPGRFGAEKSQAIIGVQMAAASAGTCLMPPLFGLIANHITIALFPFYLCIALILMAIMHEMLVKKTSVSSAEEKTKQ